MDHLESIEPISLSTAPVFDINDFDATVRYPIHDDVRIPLKQIASRAVKIFGPRLGLTSELLFVHIKLPLKPLGCTSAFIAIPFERFDRF